MGRVEMVCALALLGCHREAPATASTHGPATVAHRVAEGDLSTVTLTAQAAQRLGIETAAVALRTVPRVREVGAELIVPPGRGGLLGAPFAGMVRRGTDAATVGDAVRRGDVILRIVPLAPADRDLRAQAESAVAAAAARVAAAEARTTRAAQLAQDRAGSVRAAEEAVAERDTARAALAAARARSARLRSAPMESDVALALRAPDDGVLRQVLVSDGQAVGAGAPVAEVVAMNPLWARVPLFVGDVASVDPTAAGTLADFPRPATPVQGPPTADPTMATQDLYYRVDNADGALRPGLRVALRVPLRTVASSTVVPLGAVVYDLNGGAWVYETLRALTWTRRRVDVAHVVGDIAVLTRGPAAGTAVVTVGAAELYGTEFGAGH